MNRAKVVFTAITLLAVAALCGCGGSNTPGNKSDLASLVSDSPESAEQLVTDPLRFIRDYSASPDGSIEQSIILVLESLLDPTIIPQQLDAPPEEEGTVEYGDFFMVAEHYREHGPDDGARQRIGELMDQVFPENEILEKWTTLSTSGSSATMDLGRILSGLIPDARAQSTSESCNDVWTGVTSPRDAPEACFDVETWTHRGSEIRIFYPIVWNSNPNNYAYVNRTHDAINESLDKYAGELGLENENIDVWIHTADLNDRTRADATLSVDDIPCRIRLFPKSYLKEGSAPEAYRANIAANHKQTIAHEVYHCFQGWNYRGPFFGPKLSGSVDSEAYGIFKEARKWWTEGTAEFFGNYVYPCNQREHERISGFDRDARSVPLIELEYENVVFFMYMGSIDPTSIIEMSRSMAVGGGFDEQYEAAAGFGLGRTFHEFAKQYVDRNIRDSCPGTKMDVRPTIDIYDVQRGSERVFDIARFLLVRVDLSFLSGDYGLEYEMDSADARLSAREFIDRAWKPAPLSVNAGCQERHYRFIGSYSRSDVISDSLVIRETSPADAASERTSSIDSCLIGTWRATDASMQAIGSWLAANPLTRTSVVSEKEEVTGDISGTFRRNGSVTGRMRDFTQKYISHINMGSTNLTSGTTVIMNDRTGARYSAESGVLTVWDVCSQPLTRAIVELEGQVISDMLVDMESLAKMDAARGIGKVVRGDPGDGETEATPDRIITEPQVVPIPSEFQMHYSCSGGTLEVKDPEHNSGMPAWRFRKVSSE